MRKGIEENGRRKRTEGKRKAVILWSGDKTGCGESGKMAVPGGSGWLCHRAASTLFSFALKGVTAYRKANEWIFFLLPVMGLIIVFLYEKIGKEDGGTNQVLSTVRLRMMCLFYQHL